MRRRKSTPSVMCSSTWNAVTTSQPPSGRSGVLEERGAHVEPPLAGDLGGLLDRLGPGGGPAAVAGHGEHLAGAAAHVEQRALGRPGRLDEVEPLARGEGEELLEQRVEDVEAELRGAREVALDVDLLGLAVLGREHERAGAAAAAARAARRGRRGWIGRHHSRGTRPAGGSSWAGDSTRHPRGRRYPRDAPLACRRHPVARRRHPVKKLVTRPIRALLWRLGYEVVPRAEAGSVATYPPDFDADLIALCERVQPVHAHLARAHRGAPRLGAPPRARRASPATSWSAACGGAAR